MRERKIQIDAILKWIMLVAGLGLMLAWSWKALTMKDILVGKLFHVEENSYAGQVLEQGKMWTVQGLVSWIRQFYPVGRMNAGDSLSGSGTTAGNRSQTREMGRVPDSVVGIVSNCLASWIVGHSPLIQYSYTYDFYSHEQARAATIDSDPSYGNYLLNQKLMEESRYFLLYGDENSQLGMMEDVEGTEDGQADMMQQLAVRPLTELTPAYDVFQGMPVTGTGYVLEQLMDYDFLMSNFFSVHSSTTAGRDEMDAAILLSKDLSIEKSADEPRILIYHTHSQETFADYSEENPGATVVGIGNYLTTLLEQKGYRVIHDTTEYDIMNGQLDRNYAYNYALDGITKILQQYPSIEVVLDVHRDGVGENVHLVSQVNGKPTAQIMFFNGMSQTPEGPIEYLVNPYKEDNLAFSLQMQLDAAAYFPGLTRKIYLKGLRYNLHVRPRASLIEVGAQTNTYQEALNAMEPLAEILDMVLSGS